MGTTGPRGRVAAGATSAALTATLLLTAVACGSPPPAPPPPDPALRAYCDTVLRVQAEQSAPDAGRGGVTASAAATRRQLDSLVRVAPPEVAGDWRALRALTERSLRTLEQTGGDAAKIDRAALSRVRQESAPVAERVKTVTEQRCGITFRAPS